MKMKAVKSDLQSVIKSLKLLTEKAEKIAGQLDAVKNIKATPSRIAKVSKSSARKKTSTTATDTVMNIIKRQKKGIDTAALKKKTDFDTKTIRNVIFRLKKQRKVQSTDRGVYVAI